MGSCVAHQAGIYDRGGRRQVAALDGLEMVRWNRVRDDISSAVVWLQPKTQACVDALRDVRSGRHELVVFREGARVWEGPITRIAARADFLEIEARDVMLYVHRTLMHSAYSSAYPNVETVTGRMQRIMEAELVRKESLTPPVHILEYLDIRTGAETARTTRTTKAYQMSVWSDIDEMAARSGLDYTVVGRRIVANDVHDVIGRTAAMTSDDFLSDPVVTEYGMELATLSAVTDGAGNWGAVGGVDDYYGEWELLATAYEEDVSSTNADPPTTAELRGQARRNASSRYPAPLIVRIPDGSLLNPRSTALTPGNAVPGIRVPLRASLLGRQIEQEQKLDYFQVQEDSAGEQASLRLSPAPGVVPDSWESAGSEEAT